MPRSFKGSQAFDSDGDGSYDVSFFASSVRHSSDLSKRAFAIFGDGKYSDASGDWMNAPYEERRAFLLEHHEATHHGLLFSTPAGVLLWRVNQVLSRDISYVSENLKALGIEVPVSKTPRAWLVSEEFVTRLRAHPSATSDHKSYFLKVIDAIEKHLQFREILFGKGAVSYPDTTIGELIELFNFVYQYLAERCGVAPSIHWTSRSDTLDSKVFRPHTAFNLMDIIECHAIAKELYLLRAVGDLNGFKVRLEKATGGQWGLCLKQMIEMAKMPNEIGFSPHAIQMAALLACSGTIDIVQKEPLEVCIEDELPWWRLTGPENINSSGSYLRSIESLSALNSEPLIGAGSQWIRFSMADDDGSASPAAQFIEDLSSFGLDLQIALIHRGAHQNLVFLMENLVHPQNTEPLEAAFEQWNSFLLLNKAFVEYDDTFFLFYMDLDQLHKQTSPLRQLPCFQRLYWPHNQFMAHLVNGALIRRTIAQYEHMLIPSSAIIMNKLDKFIADTYAEQFSESQCADLAQIIRSQIALIFKEGRDLPFGPDHLFESTKGNRFI